MDPEDNYDVVIVGGGPAGLSAATLLGRCIRKVLVCDAGRPRNEASSAMNGFIALDGIAPAEFLQMAREKLTKYETVRLINTTVEDVTRQGVGFTVACSDGAAFSAKAVLIATGLIDLLPAVPGLKEFYGSSVHHCPFCDAWEHRGGRIGVLGADEAAVSLALELLIWTPHVSLFTLGMVESPDTAIDRLRTLPIHVIEGAIQKLEGSNGRLQFVKLEDQSTHPCDALFFSPAQAQHSSLARRLGCDVDPAIGTVNPHHNCSTAVQGLFVAGNVSKGIQMALIAAAEGLTAGAAINDWLLELGQSYLST